MSNIIRLVEPVSVRFDKSCGSTVVTFASNTDYFISNSQLSKVTKDPQFVARLFKVSKAEPRIRNFHFDAFKQGSKILFWNGSGGYGDAIMALPVLKILSKKFDVHVLSEPGNNILYWNMPFIKTVQILPVQWDHIKLFDAFADMECVVNADGHQDQQHPVDTMLNKFGINPSSVPPEEKSIRPVFTANELGSLRVYANKKFGIYQLSASNKARSMSASDSVYIAAHLAEQFPDVYWLCAFDSYVDKDYTDKLDAMVESKGLKNIQKFCAPNLRELIALTEKAAVVVAPDSLMVHAAGCFGTPCVGLWGPVCPDRRVAYYKNHLAIQHKEYCQFAPCFAYGTQPPAYCPARLSNRAHCDLMSGIAAEEVEAAVREIIAPKTVSSINIVKSLV